MFLEPIQTSQKKLVEKIATKLKAKYKCDKQFPIFLEICNLFLKNMNVVTNIFIFIFLIFTKCCTKKMLNEIFTTFF